ncbi:heavy metal-binding domain-containing protein [Salegentibacter flavus]|uniref:heavy metal-binding domain-containing protein n=1 Tax=Salegentibacter flavus TaxID=287099 RepID=UPI0015871C9A|nr:heavy metal-binding domain-containing protein [Salegentibacter flavus]
MLDLVSVNVVVGTNFFSDFGASFTDLLGGLSGTYRNKLEKIYKVGLDKLKLKATNIGGNAILG